MLVNPKNDHFNKRTYNLKNTTTHFITYRRKIISGEMTYKSQKEHGREGGTLGLVAACQGGINDWPDERDLAVSNHKRGPLVHEVVH